MKLSCNPSGKDEIHAIRMNSLSSDHYKDVRMTCNNKWLRISHINDFYFLKGMF